MTLLPPPQRESRLYQPIDLDEGDLLYFLHIPKTAGTSLTAFIEDHFPMEALCPERYIVETLAIPADQWRRYRCVCGHQGYHLLEALPRPPVCVTMLRDPVDRALSHYAHIQRTPDHPLASLLRGMDLETFVHHPVGMCELCNVQTRFIGLDDREAYFGYYKLLEAGRFDRLLDVYQDRRMLDRALERLDGFAFAGLCEQYDLSVMLLCHVLGWPAPLSNPRYNVNPDHSRSARISDRVLDQIRSLTRLDRALYDAVQARFARTIAGLDAAQMEARYEEAMRRRPLESSVHLRFEKPIQGGHWLGRELLNDGSVCRWTGPEAECFLDFRIDTGRDWTLQFCLGTPAPNLLATVELSVDETPVRLERWRAQPCPGFFSVFGAHVPSSLLRAGAAYSRFRFRVGSTTFLPREDALGSDDRTVGMFFRWLDLF